MAEEYRKYRSSEWYTDEEIDEYERRKLTKEVSQRYEEKLNQQTAEIEELKKKLAEYESQKK